MAWNTGFRKSAAVLSITVVIPTACTTLEQDSGEEENEVQVRLAECPGPVQKTIEREAGAGRILEIERELEQGKTVYEAEVVIDGQEHEITVAADGTLLGKDQEGAEDDDDVDDENAKGEGSAQ